MDAWGIEVPPLGLSRARLYSSALLDNTINPNAIASGLELIPIRRRLCFYVCEIFTEIRRERGKVLKLYISLG